MNRGEATTALAMRERGQPSAVSHDTSINATMAALRRLISTFTNFTYTPGRFAGAKQQFQTTKTLKLITTGVCLATGAGIAHYCNAIHNMRIALASDIGGRWLLSLPSVSAKDKVRYTLTPTLVIA